MSESGNWYGQIVVHLKVLIVRSFLRAKELLRSVCLA